MCVCGCVVTFLLKLSVYKHALLAFRTSASVPLPGQEIR